MEDQSSSHRQSSGPCSPSAQCPIMAQRPQSYGWLPFLKEMFLEPFSLSLAGESMAATQQGILSIGYLYPRSLGNSHGHQMNQPSGGPRSGWGHSSSHRGYTLNYRVDSAKSGFVVTYHQVPFSPLPTSLDHTLPYAMAIPLVPS